MDVIFDGIEKSKPKPERKARGIGSQIERGAFSPKDQFLRVGKWSLWLTPKRERKSRRMVDKT